MNQINQYNNKYDMKQTDSNNQNNNGKKIKK